MYSIGRLAKLYGLSRSTLIYYDKIGLLKPSARTRADYRQYSQGDAKRLEQVCVYRQAGVPLKNIRVILESPDSRLGPVLEKRLDELNEEILRLRNQQHLIIRLLKNDALLDRIAVMNKATWVGVLKASGLSEEDLRRWHIDFERTAPEKHRKFLDFLSIPEDDIRNIRSWATALDDV